MKQRYRFLLLAYTLMAFAGTVSAQSSSLLQAPAGVSGLPSIPAFSPAAGNVTHSGSPAIEHLARLRQNPDYDPRYDGDAYRNGGSDPQRPVPPPPPAYPPYDAYRQVERPAVALNEASWTYQPPPPLRVFRKNDVVTIRVDEITRMMAEGTAENRKRTLYEAILTDWIRLKDFKLRPAPQPGGDPAVAAVSNNNYRAESTVESRESLTFNIAATVVDIRPNGNLVLQARKAIRVNDNLWETSLSGMCRVDDIAPDNVVLSKDLIDLEIRKEDRGHLRDGYSRGWMQRFVDRFGPF